MLRGPVVREAVTGVALLLALGVAALSVWRLARLRAVVVTLRIGGARVQTHDRLIGTAVDLAGFGVDSPPGATGHEARPTLLWILDLERCSGCFDGVGGWTRLEQLEGHDFILILVGTRTRAVDARLRALRKTQVMEAKREDVFAQLGSILPNTKLLLDAERIAVLVDSRASGEGCGWSFEGQVATLKGLDPARSIRARVQ